MSSTLQQHLDAIAADFTEGRIDGLARFVSLPLPIYREGALLVCRDLAEFRSWIGTHRSQAARAGLLRLTGRLVAQSIPRKGRVQLWADWHYQMRGAIPNRSSTVRYYCHEGAEGLQCNMLEFRAVAFQDNPAEVLAPVAVGY